MNIQNELISVVVPIYNVEEYLPRCLDSIIAQTYTNIEIMLIDDGSPDNAGMICDEYAARDSRIRVFHIPNGGVAKARQLGVESSIGEYIVFVDPDDWLPLSSIDVLYSNMTEDVDIVIGSNTNICKYKKTYNRPHPKLYSNNEYLEKTIAFEIIGFPWGRLLRRHLFSQKCFYNIPRAQDWLMNIDLAIKSRATRVIMQNVYYYVVGSGSSTYINFKLNFTYYKNLGLLVNTILRDNNLFEQYKYPYMITLLRLFGEISSKGVYIDRNDDYIVDVLHFFKTNRIPGNMRINYWAIRSNIFSYIVKTATYTKYILSQLIIRIYTIFKK